MAFLLFGLSLYLAGIVVILPAALTLFIALAVLWRKIRNFQSFAEYGVFAWLVAAQVSILVGILLQVVPNLRAPFEALI
ncbi:MAG: hypothetical protein ACRESR_07540 [Gammaproteobacteria bacterium]